MENNTNEAIIVKKEESAAVTTLSVIGLILGAIALLGSFIPCLGALAIFIATPAAICSGIGLFLAKQKKVSMTLSIIALVISCIAIIISGFQLLTLNGISTVTMDQIEESLEAQKELQEQLKIEEK